MQKFTLIHDGSKPGWQATYLAFHLSARLEAPLGVFFKERTRKEALEQRVSFVKAGALAAGVSIEIHFVKDFSVESIKQFVKTSDGLFLSNLLISDRKTALPYLTGLSCPLWVVSKKTEINRMAVLISGQGQDDSLLAYSKAFARRLREPLTGILLNSSQPTRIQKKYILKWEHIPSFTPANIFPNLRKLGTDLVFVPASSANLLRGLPCNCVILPAKRNA